MHLYILLGWKGVPGHTRGGGEGGGGEGGGEEGGSSGQVPSSDPRKDHDAAIGDWYQSLTPAAWMCSKYSTLREYTTPATRTADPVSTWKKSTNGKMECWFQAGTRARFALLSHNTGALYFKSVLPEKGVLRRCRLQERHR